MGDLDRENQAHSVGGRINLGNEIANGYVTGGWRYNSALSDGPFAGIGWHLPVGAMEFAGFPPYTQKDGEKIPGYFSMRLGASFGP